MKIVDRLPDHADVTWDGSRILFEILDGTEHVSCAISRSALEDLSSRRLFKSADILACFAKSRARIERLASTKFKARAAGVSGRLSLWSDDLDLPPPDGGVEAARARPVAARERA